MSVSDLVAQSARNALYQVAAGVGVLLGLLLLAGASGHFTAVWPALDPAATPSPRDRFALLLPGAILLTSGVVNVALCRALWIGRRWSVTIAMAANVLAMIYFAYLFNRGVPDHPIGVFLASVASFVILLCGIRLGLTWPAKPPRNEVP